MSNTMEKKSYGGPKNFGPREMTKTVCSDCGKECEVPFKPTEGRPVYCRDCLPKHRKPRFWFYQFSFFIRLTCRWILWCGNVPFVRWYYLFFRMSSRKRWKISNNIILNSSPTSSHDFVSDGFCDTCPEIFSWKITVSLSSSWSSFGFDQRFCIIL